MSIAQTQLVRWSLPAFALILGLLWYKRRRVDRVDPGGISKTKGDTTVLVPGSCTPKSTSCDSGIHSDDSRLTCSTPSSPEEIISPRKVSESLDIPNRKSSSVSMSILNNTPWYETEPDTPEMNEIQLGSNPCKSGFDFMSKSLKKSPTIEEETNNSRTVAKIVVAKSATESIAAEFKISSSNDSDKSLDEQKNQRQSLSDRDSANHSPVSGVLEGSVHDEARSEGSTDSGKGGSITELHPEVPTLSVYEFVVPMKLVGKLIGKGGRFLQKLKNNTGINNVVVKLHSNERDCKICSIEGTPDSIQAALELIRQNFPEKTYPHLTLEQIAYEEFNPDEITWSPELMYLNLVEGVNNDVIISSIVKPNHFFLQLPTHPTFPLLAQLEEKMTYNYDNVESPVALPPNELAKGMIMVAKWYNRWVRVIVEAPDLNGEVTLVRLADHGGFYTFSHSQMRKIKMDYLALPFQAIEVFLANIQAKEEWSSEAFQIVQHICRNGMGQAQIEAFFDSQTFISIYFTIHKYGVISLADELVARGFAEYIPFEEVVTEEPVPLV